MNRLFMILFLVLTCTGFRVFTNGNHWSATSTSPKLFVRFCSTPFTLGTNNLPPSDPLYNQTLTTTQVVSSIFNDFNNVPNAFINLVDAATDGDFASLGADRTIDVCVGSTSAGTGGVAEPKYEGSTVTGCKITISDKSTEKLKDFVSTLTHELGHCVGLDHSQESTHAIMSYFYKSTDSARLQIDDKMGLIYLYPDSLDNSREESTYGLSCAPR